MPVFDTNLHVSCFFKLMFLKLIVYACEYVCGYMSAMEARRQLKGIHSFLSP